MNVRNCDRVPNYKGLLDVGNATETTGRIVRCNGRVMTDVVSTQPKYADAILNVNQLRAYATVRPAFSV